MSRPDRKLGVDSRPFYRPASHLAPEVTVAAEKLSTKSTPIIRRPPRLPVRPHPHEHQAVLRAALTSVDLQTASGWRRSVSPGRASASASAGRGTGACSARRRATGDRVLGVDLLIKHLAVSQHASRDHRRQQSPTALRTTSRDRYMRSAGSIPRWTLWQPTVPLRAGQRSHEACGARAIVHPRRP